MLKDSKFTEIDEEFICEHCGKLVPKLEYSCRNHCPYCLYSKNHLVIHVETIVTIVYTQNM